MMRTNSQPGNRRSYYTRYISHYAKKNYTVLILGALFVTGVVMGTLLVRGAASETLSMLLRIVGGYVEKRREQGLYQNFFAGAVGVLGVVVALFISGFCAISQPGVACVPIFRGLGFGFSAGSLYASYGAAATGYIAVYLLPGMLLSTLILLFCCNEAMRLSNHMLGLLRAARQNTEGFSVRVYCARFLVMVILCVVAAFVEAILLYAFSGVTLL